MIVHQTNDVLQMFYFLLNVFSVCEWHPQILKIRNIFLKPFRASGVVVRRCFIKKVFLKYLYQTQACNFIKKKNLAQVFSCEFCEISKNTFFTEHLRWLLLHKSNTNPQYYQLTISLIHRTNNSLTMTVLRKLENESCFYDKLNFLTERKKISDKGLCEFSFKKRKFSKSL